VNRVRTLANVLVTGGAGFIGTNFIRSVLTRPDFAGRVINFDALTYAGNLLNLQDITREFGGSRYVFVKGDICDRAAIESVFRTYQVDTVVHFAAESHVDRSILGPEAFVQTNIVGTYTLLEVARAQWEGRRDVLFHHISTDEVYGSLEREGRFREDSPYDPRSPYSASKAASDHLAMAYFHTFGLPVTLSNSSNNYGPYQFPEKLIPLMILNMKDGKPLPIYGDGTNIRDWLYVGDHVDAIWQILTRGVCGQKYNIGGGNEWENRRLVAVLCEITAAALGRPAGEFLKLMTFVKDRPGHDRRYAVDSRKIGAELGWRPRIELGEGLAETVSWYLRNAPWVEQVLSGEYRNWIDRNYAQR
jgi:dTDP-glucose 4,6-dehydratase